jgi:hypothetical protein
MSAFGGALIHLAGFVVTGFEFLRPPRALICESSRSSASTGLLRTCAMVRPDLNKKMQDYMEKISLRE